MKRIIYLLLICLSLIILLTCKKESTSTSQSETKSYSCAYLDIETTGLKHSTSDITVIGIYLEKGDKQEFIQLVGDEIISERLIEIFKNVDCLYTYNGVRFDLAFIKKKLNLDPAKYCNHIDLMNICHKKNLYGGLKKVEEKLGIQRESGLTGRDAIKLWYKYKDYGDKEALKTLLEYNKEDVINLSKLKQILDKHNK